MGRLRLGGWRRGQVACAVSASLRGAAAHGTGVVLHSRAAWAGGRRARAPAHSHGQLAVGGYDEGRRRQNGHGSAVGCTRRGRSSGCAAGVLRGRHRLRPAALCCGHRAATAAQRWRRRGHGVLAAMGTHRRGAAYVCGGGGGWHGGGRGRLGADGGARARKTYAVAVVAGGCAGRAAARARSGGGALLDFRCRADP